jgi:glutaredoxin 3
MSEQSPRLALYYFEACPFCQRVIATINKLRIKIEFCDTFKTQEHTARLYRDTGRTTVPCLYIDNSPMHESADIINWLESNAEQLEKES